MLRRLASYWPCASAPPLGLAFPYFLAASPIRCLTSALPPKWNKIILASNREVPNASNLRPWELARRHAHFNPLFLHRRLPWAPSRADIKSYPNRIQTRAWFTGHGRVKRAIEGRVAIFGSRSKLGRGRSKAHLQQWAAEVLGKKVLGLLNTSLSSQERENQIQGAFWGDVKGTKWPASQGSRTTFWVLGVWMGRRR